MQTRRVSGALHPGVVQKAERFVAAAQLKLASSLPREVVGRLRVVVHTHTDVEVRYSNTVLLMYSCCTASTVQYSAVRYS